MDLTGQKAALDKLSLSELRQLGRDEIEELVTTGLLEAGRAEEIFVTDNQHQQDEQQQAAVNRRSQAEQKAEEQKKDEDWLQHMSESYQRTFHELMDTYDNVESKYGTMKTRAEKLKDNLREKMETAYRFGIPLPDGEVAFYDRKNNDFVDGTTLQPLNGDDAKVAADAYEQLSPRQQHANACYVDACHAYGDADDISRSADAGGRDVQNAKQAAENSNGTLSETDLAKAGKDTAAKADKLSARLDNSENADANLDAALSADTDGADAPKNSTTNPQAQPISFASQIDTSAKAIGGGNGKTAAAFNTAVNSSPASGDAPANNPSNNRVYRSPSVPAP